jgi:acetoacetate decarboxylase
MLPGPRRLLHMMAFGDFIYRDAHYLACEMEIDERAARAWVPWPLRLAKPAMATVFTAWFPQTTFGSVYREAGILLHVTNGPSLFGKPALFSPWMLVDDDVALIMGRELLGYPKKLGSIDFDIAADGNSIHAVAARRGTELVRMEAKLGDRVENSPPMLGRPHRNVRASIGLAIPLVIAFTPKERAIEVRKAEVKVTIGGSERDPLSDLGFGAVRSAHLHRVDLAASLPPIPVGIASPVSFARQLLSRVW